MDEKVSIAEKDIGAGGIYRCRFRGTVSECDIQGCSGSLVNLDGMSLTRSTARGADITMVNLSGAQLSGCDLSGMDIANCKLDGMTINGIPVEALLNNYKENINMKKNVRKAIIAGNWKMNKTRPEAKALLEELKPMVADVKDVEIVACVPFTNLETALAATAGTNIKIGAENCHFEKSGAFTGEISADMLKELGVKYVIIGHSERRQYFNETDEACGKKVQVALENGLRPILCVGESLTEREQDVTMEVIRKQIKIALQNVAVEDIKKVVIAYEPIWAIGTGKTATAEQANEVCSAIRDCLREKYGARAARGITIQYGGSMNAKNASELLAQPDVDGGLIGGASLKSADFATIVEAANQ